MFGYSATLVLLFVTLCSSATRKLPSYIEPCRQSDPKLEQCILEHGNKIIPIIAKGDKVLKVPNYTPLKLDEVIIEPSDNFHMKLTNVIVSELELGKIIDVTADVQNRRFKFVLNFPVFHVMSDYTLDGKILILALSGSGKSNFTFENTNFTINIQFSLEKVKGAEYAKILDSSASHVTGRLHCSLDNLFNGDKFLGAETLKFINENWKEIDVEVGPGIDAAINAFAVGLISRVFQSVPFNEIVLP